MRSTAREFGRARRAAAVVAISAAALVTAGCQAPPWLDPTDAPASTPPATSTPPAAIQNDLASGSATRTMEVGAITLTADYWSTLSMDRWTVAAQKPLTFSLRSTVTPSDGQKVYLSRVTATPVVRAADGSELPGFDPIVDQATVAPGYLVLDPYTYSQTFTLPPLDPQAASVELSMRYELLMQSTPTASDYAKQTAVDTLVIAIAGDDAAAADPSPAPTP